MPNRTTTQNTLTKLDCFTTFTYTIYNIYNTIQITIQYTIPSKSLHVGSVGVLYWYITWLTWLGNQFYTLNITPTKMRRNCLPFLYNSSYMFFTTFFLHLILVHSLCKFELLLHTFFSAGNFIFIYSSLIQPLCCLNYLMLASKT